MHRRGRRVDRRHRRRRPVVRCSRPSVPHRRSTIGAEARGGPQHRNRADALPRVLSRRRRLPARGFATCSPEGARRQPADVAGSFCDWVNTDPDVGLEAFKARQARHTAGHDLVRQPRSGARRSSPRARSSARRSCGRSAGSTRRSLAPRTPSCGSASPGSATGSSMLNTSASPIAVRRRRWCSAAPTSQLDALLTVFRRAARGGPAVAGKGPLPRVDPLADDALGLGSGARRSCATSP